MEDTIYFNILYILVEEEDQHGVRDAENEEFLNEKEFDESVAEKNCKDEE